MLGFVRMIFAVILVGVVVLIVVAINANNSHWRSEPASSTTAPSPAAAHAAAVWTPMSQALVIQDCQVWIVSAKIGKVPLKALGSESSSKDELLMVTVGIKNTTAEKKIDYETWGATPIYDHSPATLSDEHGNSYKRITFGIGSDVVGRVERSESIYPGKTLTDVLVFEVPIAAAKSVRLELPGENIGVAGRLRFEIPASAWKK